MSAANQVVDGFSLTNRMLLYASVLLAPAQFISGVGSKFPASVGFIAYNMYTQVQWYQAIRDDQLGALSLLPPHFNFIYTVSYLGGVSSGSLWLGVPLGLLTAAVLVLNTVSAWTAWATNQAEGYGVYQFFFFGWRTLDDGWHKFLMLWQIGDSIAALVSVFAALGTAVWTALADKEGDDQLDSIAKRGRLQKYLITWAAIPLGAALMLVFAWPVILWTELIYARNNVDSATDYIAVWLFVAQVGLMLVPL